MACCIVCGDLAPQPLGDYRNRSEDILKRSVARFALRIFLEVDYLLEDCITIDKLSNWWTTCEECSDLFQESYEIYGQLVKLSKKIRGNRGEVVGKCQRLQAEEYSNRDLEDSSDIKPVARKFRDAVLNCGIHAEEFTIHFPSYERVLKEEVEVKEEELSNEEGTEEDDVVNYASFSDTVKEENFTSNDEENDEDGLSGKDDSGEGENYSSLPRSEEAISKGETQESPASSDGYISETETHTQSKENSDLDVPPTPKRKPGRPRKAKEEKTVKRKFLKLVIKPPKKRGRGRPRKIHQEHCPGVPRVKSKCNNDLMIPDQTQSMTGDKDGEPHSVEDNSVPEEGHCSVQEGRMDSSSPSAEAPPNHDGPTPPKRRRGRPRKSGKLPVDTSKPTPPKRKLGRPKKPGKLPVDTPKPPKPKSPLDFLKRDPVTKIYSCPECDYKVKNRLAPMTLHFRTVHLKEFVPRKIFECPEPGCGRTFMKPDNFQFHMDRHKGTPRYQCAECPLRFYDRRLHSRHVVREHKGGRATRPHICNLCGKGFAIRDYLYNHRYAVHSTIFYKRKRVPGGEPQKKTICEICGKSVNERSLRFHMQNSHGLEDDEIPEDPTPEKPPKKTVCEICGKSVRDVYLGAHMRNMHGGGNVGEAACKLCGKRMGEQSIKLHMWNVHREKSVAPKKHVCPVCQHAFQSRKLYDLHLYSKHQIGEPVKLTTRREQWQCDVQGCRVAYTTEEKLKTHMDDIHGPDKSKPGQFECRFCGRRFFLKYRHEHHEKTHENAESKPFTCDTCGKGFPTQVYLRYHLVHTHKMKVDNRQGFRHLELDGAGHSCTSTATEQETNLLNL